MKISPSIIGTLTCPFKQLNPSQPIRTMETFRVLLELPNVGFVPTQTPNTFERTKQDRRRKQIDLVTLFYN